MLWLGMGTIRKGKVEEPSVESTLKGGFIEASSFSFDCCTDTCRFRAQVTLVATRCCGRSRIHPGFTPVLDSSRPFLCVFTDSAGKYHDSRSPAESIGLEDRTFGQITLNLFM